MTPDIFTDIGGQLCAQEINVWNSTLRLLVSLVLGSIIGLERKRKGQPAGLRTFALICMGSTLAMLLSVYVPQEFLGLKNGDPGRIAAQVITGIGFLGAGAIIRMKGSVRGLTTAAGIWITAAIGMAVGVGMYLVSVIATFAVFFVLMQLWRIEHLVNIGSEPRTVRLRLEGLVDDLEPFRKVIRRYRGRLSDYFIEYDFNRKVTTLNLFVLIKEDADTLRLIHELAKAGPTLEISLGSEATIM